MVMLLLTTSTARSTPLSLQERLRRKEVVMGVSNGIVTSPINPQEVYSLLGVAKYNGWWDVVHICSNAHKKTNPWSKKKPVVWNRLDINFTNANWWKAQDGNCGFSFGVLSGEGTYRESVSESAKYKYIPPSGGDLSPCRILDFEGYNHNALNPVSISFPSRFKISNETSYLNFSLDFSYNNADFDSNSMLSLSDIGEGQMSLSNKYFTVAIRSASTGKQMFFQSADRVGENSDMLNITLSLKDTGLNAASTDLGFNVSQGEIMEIYAFLGTELSNKRSITNGYRSSLEPSTWLSLYTEDTPPYQELPVEKGYEVVMMSASFAGTIASNITLNTNNNYGYFRLEVIKILLAYATPGHSSSTITSFYVSVVIVDDDENYLIEYEHAVERVLSQSPSQGTVTWNLTDAKNIQFALSNSEALQYGNKFKMTIRLNSNTPYTGITGNITADIVWNGSRWVIQNFVAM